MADPNPSPATRFGADGVSNPGRGRQKAARDKISTAFLEGLNEAFHEPNGEGGIKGLDAIKKVRDEDPATFARRSEACPRQRPDRICPRLCEHHPSGCGDR
jgi:hypothetical protein